MNAKEFKKLDAALTESIKQAVFDRIDAVKKEFESKLKFNIPSIPVKFTKRGNCAGVYYYNRFENGINFNLKLLIENQDEFIKNVVPHEYCHYVNHFIASANPNSLKTLKPHGKEWKSLMRFLGLEPKVSHQYKVPAQKIYKYLCGCPDGVLVGPIINKKISLTKKTQRKKYSCKKCGTILDSSIPSQLLYR